MPVVAACALGACGGADAEPRAAAPAPFERPCGPAASRLSVDAPQQSAPATVETEPVPNGGDAADDPAVWVHPRDPARSVVIGTDKKGGLAVYDLDGRELQYVEGGEPNNVDLRCGFRLGGRLVPLVTAGDRDRNLILVYRLDPVTRRLVDVAARPIEPGLDVYGSCMYRNLRTGAVYVVVASEDGEIEQWLLYESRRGRVDGRLVRRLALESQTEGCVADDSLGRLYLAEEDEGIWRYAAQPGLGARRLLVDGTGRDGHLDADVEGLAILAGPRGSGYLIASSQGDSSFVVYRRAGDNSYVGRFRVVGSDGVDGAEGTDGIEAVAAPLGPAFPRGLLVVQDGKNDEGNQNFKLVPLGAPS